MGWNSWYCWSESISDKHIRDMADAMKKSGLADYGWSYVVIDDCWQGERGGPSMAIQPNVKFKDMPALTDYVHKLGLKIGIYSSPWMGTYAGFIGGSAPNEKGDYSAFSIPLEKRGQPTQLFGGYPGTHRQKTDRVGAVWFMDKDAQQWADWGFDFVKLDWDLNDISLLKPVYDAVRAASRDIVISLSNHAQISKGSEYPKYSEMWRTSGDIQETWRSVSSIGFAQPVWQQHLSPGTWPDPDMLQVGQLGKPNEHNVNTHPSRLTSNEQYTQITLWSMLQAPLMLSCDISALDDFTRGLLTNPEVLDINQDPAAKPMKVFSRDGEMQTEIWTKSLADGSLAVAFFNRNEFPLPVSLSLQKLGLDDAATVRDCWRQQDVSVTSGVIETVVGRHGCALYRIK
jgi:alpha-galactosidase